jgi:hypothetical protein
VSLNNVRRAISCKAKYLKEMQETYFDNWYTRLTYSLNSLHEDNWVAVSRSVKMIKDKMYAMFSPKHQKKIDHLGNRHLDRANRKMLALTSPTSGGRSVGIVRSRTQATEFSFSFL